MKTAFITGITGQDGCYLTRLHLLHGFSVHGITRDLSTMDRTRIDEMKKPLPEESRRISDRRYSSVYCLQSVSIDCDHVGAFSSRPHRARSASSLSVDSRSGTDTRRSGDADTSKCQRKRYLRGITEIPKTTYERDVRQMSRKLGYIHIPKPREQLFDAHWPKWLA